MSRAFIGRFSSLHKPVLELHEVGNLFATVSKRTCANRIMVRVTFRSETFSLYRTGSMRDYFRCAIFVDICLFGTLQVGQNDIMSRRCDITLSAAESGDPDIEHPADGFALLN